MSTTPVSRRGNLPTASRMRRPIRILLVEDSAADVELCILALQRGGMAHDLYHVPDGEQALAFLRREPPFESAPRPDILLLDLNMPRMDGREFLSLMKHDSNLRGIPVVVLTNSSAEADVVESYDSHAAGYVTKPVSFSEFTEVVNRLEGFWLNVVVYSPDRVGHASAGTAGRDG